jgi:hypothetical protein
MYKSKVLIGCVILLYVFFTICEVIGEYTIAFQLESLIIPFITIIYLLFVQDKSRLFLLFLVFYSISDLFGMITENVLYYNVSSEEGVIFHEYQYYIGSSLYILAYFFLFIKISNSLSISHILRNFKIHLLVLSILNIYLVYVLQIIVKPRVEFKYECNVELVYNIVMVSVLSAALLNYIYRDNKKSLYLFFGSLFLIFSEVIDVAYIYISQKSLLSILGTSLALGGFYFFYQQSKLINEENEEKKYMVLD